MPKIYFFLLSLLLKSIALFPQCTINDYDKYISPCNTSTNTSSILYYKSNPQCDDSSPSTPRLSIYSKTPLFTFNCNFKCPPGQIIDFDVLNKKPYCKRCPMNTYSQGGIFHIQYWNDNILSLFETNCYVVKDNTRHKNTNCTKLFISQDHKSLISGRMINNDPDQYILELIYSFEAQYDTGSLLLKYKKDTISRDNFLNGEVNVFFDYELVLKDNNSTDWALFKYNYTKGLHQIAVFYSYWKDYTDKDLLFTLDSMRIEGVDRSEYKCFQCIESISYEGASYCNTCNEKSIYSALEKKCIECPKGKININGSTCIKSNRCDVFDYELSTVTDCNVNGTRTVIKKPIMPILCYQGDYQKNDPFLLKTEVPCTIEPLKDSNAPICKNKNDYYLNNYKLVKDFYYPNRIFTSIRNWKSNGQAMFIQRNPQIKKEMVLEKVVNITSHSGYVKVGVNLGKNESIVLTLNDTTELITSSGVHTVNLKNGLYVLQLIYYRKEALVIEDLDIPVELYLLHIVGSAEYNTDKGLCQQCPKETKAKQSLCLTEEEMKRSNGQGSVSLQDCPVYTHSKPLNGGNASASICVLDDIIESKKYNIKFNIKPYHKYIKDYCKYHPLCYQNNFIGPLNYSKGAIDLSFYFSLFEPNTLQAQAASYNQSGHIFVFANLKEDNNNYIINQTMNSRFAFKQSSIFNSITKPPIFIEKNAIVNLGTNIISVKLINFATETGLLVKYSQGGKCRNDPSQSYTSFVYYKCDKSITGFSFPKITHYFFNHCGVIFEVSSPYFCKICSSSELSASYGKCLGAKRVKIYDDSPICIFDYLKQEGEEEYQYDYSIDSMKVLLSTKSKEYQLLFGNRNHSIYNTLQDEDLGSKEGYYLSNRMEYETCDVIDLIQSGFSYFVLVFVGVYACMITFIVVLIVKYKRLKMSNGQMQLGNNSIEIIKGSTDVGIKDNAIVLETGGDGNNFNKQHEDNADNKA